MGTSVGGASGGAVSASGRWSRRGRPRLRGGPAGERRPCAWFPVGRTPRVPLRDHTLSDLPRTLCFPSLFADSLGFPGALTTPSPVNGDSFVPSLPRVFFLAPPTCSGDCWSFEVKRR